MKKKQVLLAIYILVMTLLVVWLFNSDNIISNFINQDRINLVNFYDILDSYMKDKVEYSAQGVVDFWVYSGGMAQKVNLTGWGFCQTKVNNDNRSLTLLLNSTENERCYAISLDLTHRPDIPFSHASMDIPTDYVGYENTLSLLTIENGIYDIYMCCWENSENHGISYSGWQLEKNGDDIEFHTWRDVSTMLEVNLQVTDSERPIGYLDSISSEDNYFRIQDWVFVNEQNCEEQEVVIEFKDDEGKSKQFSTAPMLRTDVAALYNDNKYAMSGYKMRIPVDYLNDGHYLVSVLVGIKGIVYCSESYDAMKTGTEITLH